MNGEWHGRPVVVTGGLGFIGSNLAIRLVEEGASVTVIDLPEPDCAGQTLNIEPVADRLRLIRADLCSPGPWQAAVQAAQVVFHLAAQVSHSASMSNPLGDMHQNCGSLLQVLEAVRQAPSSAKVVFSSTRQVYGRAQSLPIRESHPLHPPDINGVHKVAAEDYLRIYGTAYGVKSVTVRLANTYGPRMDLRNPGRGVLNVFLSRALQGEPLTVFGDGSQLRDINYVDDVVEALLCAAALEDPGPFHLGGLSPMSLSDFLSGLQSLVPLKVVAKPFPEELQAIDIGDSHCDFTRFHQATGWSPATPFATGLEQTLTWFASQQNGKLTVLPRPAFR
jgi:UDP-glucose 4-epimerase